MKLAIKFTGNAALAIAITALLFILASLASCSGSVAETDSVLLPESWSYYDTDDGIIIIHQGDTAFVQVRRVGL